MRKQQVVNLYQRLPAQNLMLPWHVSEVLILSRRLSKSAPNVLLAILHTNGQARLSCKTLEQMTNLSHDAIEPALAALEKANLIRKYGTLYRGQVGAARGTLWKTTGWVTGRTKVLAQRLWEIKLAASRLTHLGAWPEDPSLAQGATALQEAAIKMYRRIQLNYRPAEGLAAIEALQKEVPFALDDEIYTACLEKEQRLLRIECEAFFPLAQKIIDRHGEMEEIEALGEKIMVLCRMEDAIVGPDVADVDVDDQEESEPVETEEANPDRDLTESTRFMGFYNGAHIRVGNIAMIGLLQLPPSMLCVLLAMVRHAPKICPGIAKVSKLTGLSTETVSLYIRRLVKFGVLEPVIESAREKAVEYRQLPWFGIPKSDVVAENRPMNLEERRDFIRMNREAQMDFTERVLTTLGTKDVNTPVLRLTEAQVEELNECLAVPSKAPVPQS